MKPGICAPIIWPLCQFRLRIISVDCFIITTERITTNSARTPLLLQYVRCTVPELSHGRFGHLLWVILMKHSKDTGIAPSFQYTIGSNNITTNPFSLIFIWVPPVPFLEVYLHCSPKTRLCSLLHTLPVVLFNVIPMQQFGPTAKFKATYCVHLPRPLTYKIKPQFMSNMR